MDASEVIRGRVMEELSRRQEELNDPALESVTVVVRMDTRARLPGAILFRPEYKRTLPTGRGER